MDMTSLSSSIAETDQDWQGQQGSRGATKLPADGMSPADSSPLSTTTSGGSFMSGSMPIGGGGGGGGAYNAPGATAAGVGRSRLYTNTVSRTISSAVAGVPANSKGPGGGVDGAADSWMVSGSTKRAAAAVATGVTSVASDSRGAQMVSRLLGTLGASTAFNSNSNSNSRGAGPNARSPRQQQQAQQQPWDPRAVAELRARVASLQTEAQELRSLLHPILKPEAVAHTKLIVRLSGKTKCHILMDRDKD